jgi:leucine efflux protein
VVSSAFCPTFPQIPIPIPIPTSLLFAIFALNAGLDSQCQHPAFKEFTMLDLFGVADYGAFCAAVLLFLALPGPGTFALITSTGKGGFRAGAAATLGVILGDQVLMWLAVGGVAALLAANPVWFKGVQYLGGAYLVWIGLKLIFAKSGSSSPVTIEPRQYARQSFFITLLNPKAIVFYMAFFPLFIDPTQHRGVITFVAMAGTIAAITAAYGLLLCAFANLVSAHVKAHKRWARGMERLAGVFLVGFGIRLGSQ